MEIRHHLFIRSVLTIEFSVTFVAEIKRISKQFIYHIIGIRYSNWNICIFWIYAHVQSWIKYYVSSLSSNQIPSVKPQFDAISGVTGEHVRKAFWQSQIYSWSENSNNFQLAIRIESSDLPFSSSNRNLEVFFDVMTNLGLHVLFAQYKFRYVFYVKSLKI